MKRKKIPSLTPIESPSWSRTLILNGTAAGVRGTRLMKRRHFPE